MNSCRRKPCDNAYFEIKRAIRLEAIQHLSEVRVLDAFCGKGLLWKGVPLDYYLGIDREKGKSKNCICGDNMKILASLDLSKFNVIDLDSYGVPGGQLLEIAENETLRAGTVLIFTAIEAAIANGQICLFEENGIKKEIYRKCPMLWNKKTLNLFYAILNRLGVRDVNLVVKDCGAYQKHYGYCVLQKI